MMQSNSEFWNLLADELFAGGAAVIFAAAGCANAEIAAVAKERKKLVIGYESNQNYLERGYVITSLNIRWDDVVFEELCFAGRGGGQGGVREGSTPVGGRRRGDIPLPHLQRVRDRDAKARIGGPREAVGQGDTRRRRSEEVVSGDGEDDPCVRNGNKHQERYRSICG